MAASARRQPARCSGGGSIGRLRRGKVLAIGHELRLSSLWGKMKEMVDAGAVGDPHRTGLEVLDLEGPRDRRLREDADDLAAAQVVQGDAERGLAVGPVDLDVP